VSQQKWNDSQAKRIHELVTEVRKLRQRVRVLERRIELRDLRRAREAKHR